jgi:ribonucleoside-triphosphate reductase (thioredoxin)
MDTDLFRFPDQFIDQYQEREALGDHPLFQSFSGLGYVVFKRTYARPILDEDGELVRTEEWFETVRRVVEGAQAIGAELSYDEATKLYDHIWNLRAFPSGRGLWQLGTENNWRLGGDSLVNCWFVNLTTPEDVAWMFERLMLGGGVGFSVENSAAFGEIKQGQVIREETNDADFIVPDKREGWAELLLRTLRAYLEGQSFTYSTLLVRPEGAPIKTFGGVASGPGILVDGIRDICKVLDAAVGRTLTQVELLDIANIVGRIVVSGNVRRSAQIALGYPDEEYLTAKNWKSGNIPAHRAMSNNSVAVTKFDQIPEAFWNNYDGSGEPYGIVDLWTSQKYGRIPEMLWDNTIQGVNPCAEIPLAHRESCNLAEIVLPRIRTIEELHELAVILYKVQKAIAALPYLDEESNRITHENFRLGLGVTGVMQASTEQFSWLASTYMVLRHFDIGWSAVRGWPESVRLTTVKPSGTLSLLAGVTPGAHPGFARYHVRRIRISTNDPVFEWCKRQGLPWEFVRDFDGNEDSRTAVIEFPASFPSGTALADQLTAVDQLNVVKRLQREWADNAVSVTVYYRKEELEDIKTWLKTNWGKFKTVSFLLHQEHGFDQAPLEEISADEYHKRLRKVALTTTYRIDGLSEIYAEACDTGVCPVR